MHLFSGGKKSLVDYKDKLKKQKEQIPLTNEMICKGCNKKFYDEYNCICISTLEYCLLCANRNLDKETIERDYNVK